MRDSLTEVSTGFLGSERQFNETYSKPINLSRDPKSASKDQEAGALAMESLHRQVIFLIVIVTHF